MSMAYEDTRNALIRRYILQSLARMKMSPSEHCVLLVIFDETYGWKRDGQPKWIIRKDRVRISVEELAEKINSTYHTTHRALKKLIKRNVLTEHEKRQGTILGVYGINSNPSTWEGYNEWSSLQHRANDDSTDDLVQMSSTCQNDQVDSSSTDQNDQVEGTSTCENDQLDNTSTCQNDQVEATLDRSSSCQNDQLEDSSTDQNDQVSTDQNDQVEAASTCQNDQVEPAANPDGYAAGSDPNRSYINRSINRSMGDAGQDPVTPQEVFKAILDPKVAQEMQVDRDQSLGYARATYAKFFAVDPSPNDMKKLRKYLDMGTPAFMLACWVEAVSQSSQERKSGKLYGTPFSQTLSKAGDVYNSMTERVVPEVKKQWTPRRYHYDAAYDDSPGQKSTG